MNNCRRTEWYSVLGQLFIGRSLDACLSGEPPMHAWSVHPSTGRCVTFAKCSHTAACRVRHAACWSHAAEGQREITWFATGFRDLTWSPWTWTPLEHASGTAPAEAATETTAGRPTSSQHNMFRSSSIGGYLGPPAPLPQRTFDPLFSGAYTSGIMEEVVLQGSHDP